MIKIAVLIDGGFFIKRYRQTYGGGHDPGTIAKNMHVMALKHINPHEGESLYRILFYDCAPLKKKAHNPVTGASIDFARTTQAVFRLEFHEHLRALRKVALRLGHLHDGRGWIIRQEKTKQLLRGNIQVSDLEEGDVYYDVKQKGVDMKIGLDIAALAFKRLVDRIVLVSGDSDFVPAAKLARREGIDFILDPMWNPINPSLREHIDGLNSTCPKPANWRN